MNLDQNLYTQFIFKYSDSLEYNELLSRIKSCNIVSNLYIRDLSNQDSAKLRSLFSSLIATERFRYSRGDSDDMFLNVFILPGSLYIAILSLSSSFMNKCPVQCEELSKKLFRRSLDNAVYSKSDLLDTHKLSINHWKNKSAEWDPNDFQISKRKDGSMQSDCFIVTDKLADAFKSYIDKGHNAAAICDAIAGETICRSLDQKQILLNHVLTGLPLPGAPIICREGMSFPTAVKYFAKEYDMLEDFSLCSKSELYSIIGNRFLNRIPVTTYYSDDCAGVDPIKALKADTLYIQPPADTYDSPINIYFGFYENKLTLSFLYDVSVVDSAFIENIFKNFCLLLRKNIAPSLPESDIFDSNANEEAISNETAETSAKDSLSRIDKIKLDCLSKLKIFDQFDQDELLDILDTFNLEHISMGHKLINAGAVSDRLMFLCNGIVEASGVDFNLISNPLYVVRPLDIMGIEALSDTPKSMATYTAFNENVFVMSIDRHSFIELAKKHPELVWKLLNEQTHLLKRFQKLWLNT